MSPTSCRCSTPRRAWLPCVSAGVPRAGRAGPRQGGSGMSATASPPTGSPRQYSPALRRGTTGFGMGPGGSAALAATDIPDPPLLSGAPDCQQAYAASVWATAAAPGAGDAAGRGGRSALAGVRGPKREHPPSEPDDDAGGPAWTWPCGSRSRPRPLGRLGSGRLPAVHPPPIHPVVCRGPYLIFSVGSLV